MRLPWLLGLMLGGCAGKQPNGMVIRVQATHCSHTALNTALCNTKQLVQGFDRGVFGGNFHTHNMLHIPPGVDALCYSNGLLANI